MVATPASPQLPPAAGAFSDGLSAVSSGRVGGLIDPVFEQRERDLPRPHAHADPVSLPLQHGDRVAFSVRHLEVRSPPPAIATGGSATGSMTGRRPSRAMPTPCGTRSPNRSSRGPTAASAAVGSVLSA